MGRARVAKIPAHVYLGQNGGAALAHAVDMARFIKIHPGGTGLSQVRADSVLEAGKQAEQRLAGYQNMKEEIRALRASATSPDRAVTIVAGPGGSIIDVQLAPEAMRMPHHALARTFLSTVQQAVAQSARLSAEVVQRYAGDQIDIAARVNSVQEEVFGPAPEITPPPPPPPAADGSIMQRANQSAPPPPPPAPARRPGPPPADDDEGFGSILR